MVNKKDGDNRLVLSYLSLRKVIGYLGVALPFVLAIGWMLLHGLGIQGSISSYYHTEMRDIFVGILCAIAVFLMSYKGYERKDDFAGDLACVFAIGVAFFPTTPDLNPPSLLDKIIGGVHLGFAAAFLITLAYFSLFLFTKSDLSKTQTRKKLQRNVVYRLCGYIILSALGAIALLALLPEAIAAQVEQLDPVFWLEALAIVAFGISWLTKGEVILQDEA